MPVNYEEVLKDLQEQEDRLLGELNTVRAARPAIQLLSQSQKSKAQQAAPRGKYAGLGPKAALRDIFSTDKQLFSRDELFERLKAEGWTSDSKDELGVVSASLSQLRSGQEIEKVEDRWRLKATATGSDSPNTFMSSAGHLVYLPPNALEPPFEQ